MAKHRIKDLSNIDFEQIDFARDEFILPGGKPFIFSDQMCDLCGTTGTVLESKDDQKEYWCLYCENELSWYKMKNDFLPSKGDEMSFLLPEHWSALDLGNWFKAYKERRLTQEEMRKYILENGKS